MDSACISALLEPFLDAPLGPVQLDQISTYIDLLLRWNARINLTAIRDPEEIVPRHFGESLFLARHLFPRDKQGESAPPSAPPAKSENPLTGSNQEMRMPVPAGAINSPVAAPPRVIDLGSGAGFPALPLKIWAPEIHLTLIEANHKKAAFLREVIRSLTLTNVHVIPERAETVVAHLNHPADVVTFRAVEKFDAILPLAASFLSPQGRLALLLSSGQQGKLGAITVSKWHKISIPQSHSNVLLIGYINKVEQDI